jgi:hypothetical protein
MFAQTVDLPWHHVNSSSSHFDVPVALIDHDAIEPVGIFPAREMPRSLDRQELATLNVTRDHSVILRIGPGTSDPHRTSVGSEISCRRDVQFEFWMAAAQPT